MRRGPGSQAVTSMPDNKGRRNRGLSSFSGETALLRGLLLRWIEGTGLVDLGGLVIGEAEQGAVSSPKLQRAGERRLWNDSSQEDRAITD